MVRTPTSDFGDHHTNQLILRSLKFLFLVNDNIKNKIKKGFNIKYNKTLNNKIYLLNYI